MCMYVKSYNKFDLVAQGKEEAKLDKIEKQSKQIL